jgi:hypothetical protein
MATATGSTNLSMNQLYETLAVLAAQIQAPFPFPVASGLFINQANQLQFPDNAYNQNLGNSITVTQDGTWIYINTMEGQPSSGA